MHARIRARHVLRLHLLCPSLGARGMDGVRRVPATSLRVCYSQESLHKAAVCRREGLKSE
eukprot:6187991-Pleurochrysis_carterae.AAC.4